MVTEFRHVPRKSTRITTPYLDFLGLPQDLSPASEQRVLASPLSWHQEREHSTSESGSRRHRYKWSRYSHVFAYTETQSIVFNAFSLATALCDTRHVGMLEKLRDEAEFEYGAVDSGLVESLLLGGYVVPAEVDELAAQRSRMLGARTQREQLTLTLAPTMGCNFDCSYCIEEASARNRFTVMNQATQDAIVALVERSIVHDKVKRVVVAWFGGEPLLAVDTIVALSKRMIELCAKYHCTYQANMTTNGYGLDAHAREALEPCEIKFFKVSIDGPEHVHNKRRVLRSGKGTFRRILDNIVASSLRYRIVVRVHCDESNEAEILELLTLFRELPQYHRVSVYLAIVEENPASANRFSTYMSRRAFALAENRFHVEAVSERLASVEKFYVRGHFCSADVEKSFMIGPEGEKYACWADFGNTEKRIGSVHHTEHKNEVYHKEYTDFDPTVHPKCASCSVMPMCLGGCSRERLFFHEPQCGVYKFNLDERVRNYIDVELHGKVIKRAYGNAVASDKRRVFLPVMT